MGDGLELNLPITLGCLWGIFCTDLVQDLEYQVRPYEVVPGRPNAVVRESVELLYEVLPQAAASRPVARPLAWHLTTSLLQRRRCARSTGKFVGDRGGPAARQADR